MSANITNSRKYAYLVVNMCVSGLPTRNTHIYDGNQCAQRGGLQLRLTSGHREITHVVPEYAISVEDFRVSGDPGGGGPVDASRVSPNRSFRC